jgi:hypothetical protein
MSSSDQQRLLNDENDDPPTYQDATNQVYGTFIDPLITTNTPPYPYEYGSQQPTVIVLGGCPTCKVCVLYFSIHVNH